MASTIAAMVAGRHRWLARLKAEGKPLTMGRKRGGKNRSQEQIDEANRQAESRRNWRLARIRDNADRRAHRAKARQQRAEAAELEHRRQAANRGIPFWSDAAAPPGKPAGPFAGVDDSPMAPVGTSRHVGLSPPPPIHDSRRPPGMSNAAWQHVVAQTDAMVGHYVFRAEARASQPADDWRPRSIAPWVTRR